MKTPAEILQSLSLLEVAAALRDRMAGRLVAVRDNEGNHHGRTELLDDELPPGKLYEAPKKTDYRGKP